MRGRAPHRKGSILSITHGDVTASRTSRLLSHGNVARGATLALALAFSLAVARTLGAHEAGPVFTAVIAVTLVGMIGRLGSDQYVLKHASALRARGALRYDTLSWPWLRRITWACSTTAAVVVGGVSLALHGAGLASPLTSCLSLFALSIPFQCAAILNSALLRAVDRVAAGAFAEVGLSPGLAMVGLLGLHVFARATPTTAAVAFLGGSLITALWSSWMVGRVGIPHGDASTGAARPAGAVSEMTHMMTTSTLFYTMTWMPVGALWSFSTPAAVSLLTVAARFPNFLSLIPSIQVTAAVPRLAALHHSDDLAAVNAGLARINRGAAAIAVPVAVALIVAAPWVMATFGPEFGAGTSVLRALVVGQLAVVLLGFVVPVMLFADMERTAVALTIGAVLLGFPVVCLASHYAGALGAALATAAVMTAHAALCAIVIRQRTGIMTAITLGNPWRQP